MKHPSPAQSIRPLADATGVSSETATFAAEMATVVWRSGDANEGHPTAVAAGCLHAAAHAVGTKNNSTGSNGGPRIERPTHDTEIAADAGSRGRTPPNRTWNPQVGHRRSDHGGTEMTISKAASITPVSLRKHSREAATIYLDSDAEMGDSRTRERLSRMTLR